MRFVRFESEGGVAYGVIEGDEVWAIDSAPFGEWKKTGAVLPFEKVRLLAPVSPSKIVCVGLNYADHTAEISHELPDEPCLFLKPSTGVIGPGDDIIYPEMASRVDHEAELGIVIGKTAKDIPADKWRDWVLGYTCFNDVTARHLQAKDGQWTRAKGFDTFAPVGPWITDEVSPDDLGIRALVNGEVRQDSRTSRLIFPPSFLVPFISRIMTLLPGDVIATGTPSGISGMSVDDVVEIDIEGIGTLRNRVAAPRPLAAGGK